jgi:polyisoprenoid-binding protein YceI
MRRSFLALLLAASLPAVQAAEYHIDPSHTYASFEIRG